MGDEIYYEDAYYAVIDNTDEAREKFGYAYGSEECKITREDLETLLNGKALAVSVNGGEYSLFISLKH